MPHAAPQRAAAAIAASPILFRPPVQALEKECAPGCLPGACRAVFNPSSQ
jgi:hypothetical protein